MINKRFSAFSLIFELVLLSVVLTFNIMYPGNLLGFTEILLLVLTIGNITLFYNMIVQKELQVIGITLFIQFILVSVFALTQLLTNKTNVVFGIVAIVICCANILLTALNKEDKENNKRITKEFYRKDDSDNSENVKHETTNVDILDKIEVVNNREENFNLKKKENTELENFNFDEKPNISNPNIVNVNVDARKEGNNLNPPLDLDDDLNELKKNDMKISNDIDKVDNKIEVINLNVDKKINEFGGKVGESIDGVKKELDSLKKKDKNIYLVSKGGKKIHNPNCMIAQRIPKEKRVILDDIEKAVADGYTPCSVCVPIQMLKVENN